MVIKNKKIGLEQFSINQVKIARENDLLYDRFGIANADDCNLAISIQNCGIQEPLTLSVDHVLLSGHRRFAAAKYTGLKTVPVRVVDVVFNSLSSKERLETLRLYNQQREKSPNERIKEKLVDIDPKTAHLVTTKMAAPRFFLFSGALCFQFDQVSRCEEKGTKPYR